MPVYNAGEFLVDAIESILQQTYPNFEFVIVDDASTDDSYRILQSYAKRYPKIIRLYRSRTNDGVSIAVKKAINHAKGSFLARMDADDISTPDRLSKQVSYLLRHPKTVALGGQCLIIDKDGTFIGKKTFPRQFAQIKKYIFQFVPVQQPTMMIAKDRLPKTFEYYVDGMNTAEEVELFFKLFQ
jgi:glycosyltransferase involved in cell wall biosynthesis